MTFKDTVPSEILRVINGSRLYGLHTETSDHDYLSVFIETPSQVFSARNPDRTVKLHDRGPQERNTDAEDDGVSYGLRHFLKLVLGGNPTLTCALFAQPEHIVTTSPEGEELLKHTHLFLSQACKPRFYGYMTSQYKRMLGEKKGHIPNRPEIKEQHGYDRDWETMCSG